MLRACMNIVCQMAKTNPNVVLICCDQAPGVEFEGDTAGRYFMEPISEANIVGMATGLVTEGYIPYILNHATFNTRKAYEQIALDACLQKRPIRIVGMGGGLTTAHLGPTHTAIEDIAIMRAIPDMTVVVPCDAEEMVRLMPLTLTWPGTIYIRCAKYGKPIVSKEEAGFEIGKAILMREGDVLIVTNGAMTHRALVAAELLSAKRIECGVLHVHTVKPLDVCIVEHIKKAKMVISIEEHTLTGGLGSACLELLADYFVFKNVPPFYRFGLPDAFVQAYGDQDSLLEEYGLQAEQIAGRILGLVEENKSLQMIVEKSYENS